MASSIQTKPFKATKDVWILNPISGAGSYGNGKGQVAVVGRTAAASGPDLESRFLIAILCDFTGVFAVEGFDLYLKVRDSCVSRGNNVAFLVRKLGDDFGKEGGEDRSCGYGTNGDGITWDDQPASSATNQGAYNQQPGNGWIHIDITAMGQAFFATLAADDRVKGTLYLVVVAGTTGGGFDEQNAARTVAFHTVQSGPSDAPYVSAKLDYNAPPNAPIVSSPSTSTSEGTIVATENGDELTVEFLFSDPDAADKLAKAELEVYGAGATDGALGSRIATTGALTPASNAALAPTGALNAYRIRITGLPKRTGQRFRLRAQDDKGHWSPYTSVADGWIQTAYTPRKPAKPVMTTNPDAARIQGTIDSNDPTEIATGWDGEFYRDDPAGTVALWVTHVDIGGGITTRTDIAYQGEQLHDGDRVRWRHRHYGKDGVAGAWSEFYVTTMHTQVGPTITPDASTKLTSRTAQLTITFEQSSDGYEVKVYRAGALIYDTGVVTIGAAASVLWSFPAGLLNWCDDVSVSAASRPAGSGALGPFCPEVPEHIDCLPTTSLTVEA